jgi:hypothetical protein
MASPLNLKLHLRIPCLYFISCGALNVQLNVLQKKRVSISCYFTSCTRYSIKSIFISFTPSNVLVKWLPL